MVEVLKAGFYSTIQDLGRFGYRDIGVPVSGVMDVQSAKLANAVLDNANTAAVMEISMTGPELRFTAETQIAICGAQLAPMLNGQVISNNKLYAVKADSVLSFGILKIGFRSYLAVKGGFKTEMVLGSRSFYQPVTVSNVLKTGTIIAIDAFNRNTEVQNAHVKYKSQLDNSSVLEVYEGPEFIKLTDSQKKEIFSTTFKVSKFHNRMAYQIEPQLVHQLPSILTSAVLPGTVQLTPSGQLIVLMRDCQTTGGYPRVLQLTEAAVNRLSQKNTGAEFNFKLKV
jgi:biotin-dependent carboxylase-like uncharacterized protein